MSKENIVNLFLAILVVCFIIIQNDCARSTIVGFIENTYKEFLRKDNSAVGTTERDETNQDFGQSVQIKEAIDFINNHLTDYNVIYWKSSREAFYYSRKQSLIPLYKTDGMVTIKSFNVHQVDNKVINEFETERTIDLKTFDLSTLDLTYRTAQNDEPLYIELRGLHENNMKDNIGGGMVNKALLMINVSDYDLAVRIKKAFYDLCIAAGAKEPKW